MQVEIRDTNDIPPSRASELLMKLTALLGNVRDELRKREGEYHGIKLEAYRQEKTANRAKLLAETSSQYTAYREAQDTLRTANDLVGSLKYYLRNAEAEMRLGGR